MVSDYSSRSFIKSGEGAIASYQYEDIATGQGIVNFYPCVMGHPVTYTYALVTDTDVKSVLNWAPAGTYTFISSTFNLPRTMEGTGYFNTRITNGGSRVIAITIKKNDSTIATATTVSMDDDSGNYSTVLLPITIPETHFQIGDSLKLQVVSTNTGFGTSPNNAGTDSANFTFTQSKLAIPFKIDS